MIRANATRRTTVSHPRDSAPNIWRSVERRDSGKGSELLAIQGSHRHVDSQGERGVSTDSQSGEVELGDSGGQDGGV